MMNTADLETFIFGDIGTDAIIQAIDEDGEATDLTGATGITLECRSPLEETLSLAGTIYGPASGGKVLIQAIGNAFEPSVARRVIPFEGVLRWTQAGEVQYSRDRVRFTIELFP